MYVANYLGSTVSVIDTSTNSVAGIPMSLGGGYGPTEIAFAPSNGDMYVVDMGDAVSVLPTVSNEMPSLWSISSSISTLHSLVYNLTTSISATLSSIQTTLSGIASSISALRTSVNTLTTNLLSDFNSLSAAIAKIGASGPEVGTSNDATVSTSPVFPTTTSFSSNLWMWTQVSTGSPTNQTLAGFALTVTSGTVKLGVLYISTTSTPAASSQTYAIPLGTHAAGGSIVEQLRFPYSIPKNTLVFVQVVSSTGSKVVVQLQFLCVPLKP